MKIVLDAMGGDYAPQEPVAGAVQAAREYGIEIILIGRESEIRAELAKHETSGLKLTVVNATEVIEMTDESVQAIREKKDSSVVVGLNLVKQGEADAFVSAGHSGATFAAASLQLRRVRGVERAGLATVFPTKTGLILVIDVGANTEVRPEFLIQFAQMGAVYVEKVLKRPNPRVGLLSNGEEDSKGTPLVKETHQLLRQTSGINFIGNVEGKDVLAGLADVVVTDGFTGNILLKTAEGTADVMLHLLKQELTANLFFKLLALGLKPAFNKVKKALDHEEFGGAPLLGVNGVVIISHGRTKAKGIKNSIRVAREAVQNNTLETIKGLFAEAAKAKAATRE
ncbi:MAG: phosphate acyltransferase PlsX [Chloroflexi bacterium]|uniref:Phosphate acyltransferase n=1 Tax=Candidatus Chlorohelix allophototropha TaxID=3003348 RepID=A0A8T7LRH4_9CHLR|nr:phosphate acyltransferase PlsX [Chloroflexota bacterium]WJW66523.1 phosphate acyltransferase PlsX [Chloroflexota bacterium L227-S17]